LIFVNAGPASLSRGIGPIPANSRRDKLNSSNAGSEIFRRTSSEMRFHTPGRHTAAFFQPGRAKGLVAVIPPVECGFCNAELVQRASRPQMRLLNQADDLEFL
jgi:hypothetical protein